MTNLKYTDIESSQLTNNTSCGMTSFDTNTISSDNTSICDTANNEIDSSSSSWFPMSICHQYQSYDEKRIAKLASLASWVVNWFLLISKAQCFIVSESKSILAALADSAVDLVSQAVLSLAEWYIGK